MKARQVEVLSMMKDVLSAPDGDELLEAIRESAAHKTWGSKLSSNLD
jgi:hypothetical protein